MSSLNYDPPTCEKCNDEGQYCWTCGEIESRCECDIEDMNLGVCEECDEQ